MPAPLVGLAASVAASAISKKISGGGGSKPSASIEPAGSSWKETLGPGLINAAGSLGGALIGSRQAGKGVDAQMRANLAALQFQREQEAGRRADFARAMDAYNARVGALLQRYGISLPSASPDGGMGVRGPGPGVGGVMPGQRFAPPQGLPPEGMEAGPSDLGSYIRRGGFTGRGGRYGL